MICKCDSETLPATQDAQDAAATQATPATQEMPQAKQCLSSSPASAEVLIVIPARLESERLPRKILLNRTGRPLIQHTWESACRSTLADAVVIATDSDEVASVAAAFGADVIRTSPAHQNGTSRAAEAAKSFPVAKVVVNLQADEPEIRGADLDALIRRIREPSCSCTAYGIATLAAPLRDVHRNNPSAVKVVASSGWAMWFSRAAMASAMHHVGAYAFRRCTLDLLAERVLGVAGKRAGEMCPLAKAEKLEQLAWLENHYHIAVEVVDKTWGGINTPLDYDEFVWRWEQRGR